MANILLIDPPWYALQNIKGWKVSYGLASVAAVLKKNGHNCVIYDGEFGLLESTAVEENIIIDFDLYKKNLEDGSFIWQETSKRIGRIVSDLNPSIVGLTIPTAKYGIAIKIANHIKKSFPFITIVAGGPHPTILPLETIKEPSIDIVVKGEGELTFLELVSAIKNRTELNNVLGITFKSNSIVYDNPDRPYITDLDNLPFPAWDLIYEFDKHEADQFGAIFTSRGCPYRCIFCASHKIWSRKTRYMSADRVVSELQHASQKYKTKYFRFNDDTFTLNSGRVMTICELIKKSKIDIKWNCEVRADLCNYEILAIMKSAGCERVNIGIESGNPEILKYIKKDITLKQIHKAFSAIKKAGLEVMAYFMIGFPVETVRQIKDTIKLMNRFEIDRPCWSIVTPYPGTELYNEALQAGLMPSQIDWSYFFHHSPTVHISKNISYPDWVRIISDIQKKINKESIRRRRRMEVVRIVTMVIFHPVVFFTKVYKKLSSFKIGYNQKMQRKE